MTRFEEEGGVGWLLLTFGQIVSALGCLVSSVYALVGVSRGFRERVRDVADQPSLWIVLGAALGLLYSAAMFVVFSRCKRGPPE